MRDDMQSMRSDARLDQVAFWDCPRQHFKYLTFVTRLRSRQAPNILAYSPRYLHDPMLHSEVNSLWPSFMVTFVGTRCYRSWTDAIKSMRPQHKIVYILNRLLDIKNAWVYASIRDDMNAQDLFRFRPSLWMKHHRSEPRPRLRVVLHVPRSRPRIARRRKVPQFPTLHTLSF